MQLYTSHDFVDYDTIGGSKEFFNDFNINILTKHHNEIGLYLIRIKEENL